MAPEYNKETMQKGHAVSNGLFQAKTFFHGPNCPGSFPGPTLELKHVNNNGDPKTDTSPKNDCCGRPVVHQENCYFWSGLPPNFLKETTTQHSTTQLYPNYVQGHSLPTTHWVPQVPFQMMLPQSCCYPFDYVYYGLQEFQYFVVIDFEATCDKEKNPHPQEIIEFPSVLVNSRTGQVEDCFQIYVRPTHNQVLTEFCKELTGIQQAQVDEGVILSEALLMHDKWLEDKGIKHTNFAVVTWSNWDCRVMLESECRFKRIRKPPYFNRWINLKVPFGEIFGEGRRTLKEAVELAGLTWQGRAHCGLDDAKNTARLLAHLMHRGLKLSITSSIFWQSTDHPHFTHHQIPGQPEYGSPKWKPGPGPAAFITLFPASKESRVFCYCGATSMKRVVRKPGPQHGSFFFGCGNWTANRGAICSFFKWASEAPQTAT